MDLKIIDEFNAHPLGPSTKKKLWAHYKGVDFFYQQQGRFTSMLLNNGTRNRNRYTGEPVHDIRFQEPAHHSMTVHVPLFHCRLQRYRIKKIGPIRGLQLRGPSPRVSEFWAQ